MASVRVERLGKDVRDEDIDDLAALLLDAVDSNAGISFMPGLTRPEAGTWWRSLLSASPSRAVVLAARDAGRIVGTVQVQPSWAPNQPHRGDLAKLIVHRRTRGQGIAQALMREAEREAAAEGLTLLVLDTCKGGAAEHLYTALGWIRVGEIPDYALNPDGSMCTTVFFYKTLR